MSRTFARRALGLIAAMALVVVFGSAVSARVTMGGAGTSTTVCDLVTAADVEAATGVAVTRDAGIDTRIDEDVGSCLYSTPRTTDLTVQVNFERFATPDIARSAFLSGRRIFSRATSSADDFVDVQGVGDAAFRSGNELNAREHVLKGRYVLELVVQDLRDLGRTGSAKELTSAFVESAVSRLPESSSELPPPVPSSSGASGAAHAVEAERSSLPGSFPDPTQLDVSAEALGVSTLLTGLLMLMLAFPSDLFDRTLKTHYRTVRGWFGPLAQLDDRVSANIRARPQWVRFGAFMVIGAVLAALVDPSLGWNAGSLALVLGLVFSRTVVTLAFAAPEMIHMRRHYRLRGSFEALPAALLVAAVCVVASRLAHFEPGYLYGIIVGIEFSRKLTKDEHGRVAAWTAGVVLAVSFVMWFLWVPLVNAISAGDTSFPILFADAAVGMIFPIGMTTMVIGFLPLQVLDGRALLDWSKRWWIGLWAAGVLFFVWVLVLPQSGLVGTTKTDGDVVSALVPFLVFGAVSFGLWAYLRDRPPSPLELEPALAAGTAAAPIRSPRAGQRKISETASSSVAAKERPDTPPGADDGIAFCHACGARAGSGDRFCGTCGASFAVSK